MFCYLIKYKPVEIFMNITDFIFDIYLHTTYYIQVSSATSKSKATPTDLIIL